jgi:hypothetical protein
MFFLEVSNGTDVVPVLDDIDVVEVWVRIKVIEVPDVRE